MVTAISRYWLSKMSLAVQDPCAGTGPEQGPVSDKPQCQRIIVDPDVMDESELPAVVVATWC